MNLFVKIPLWDIQTIRGRVTDFTTAHVCAVCGKPLIVGKEYKQIHLLTTGEIVSYDGDDVAESQGFFPVGPECEKRLVLKFAF